MLNYLESLNIIRQIKETPLIESLHYKEAIGRVIAENVYSPISLPAFNTSAMDGFAVVSEQTSHASSQNTCELEVQHCIAAGDFDHSESSFSAVEIMTGAKVPDQFDSVIPVENIKRIKTESTQGISISAPVTKGEYIRRIAEDIKKGQLLIPVNTTLVPQHIPALAATGIETLKVYHKIRVDLVTTGNEIVDEGEQSLQGSQIRNASMPYLEAALQQAGIDAHYHGIVRDDPKQLMDKLRMLSVSTKNPRIIISTGSVSMGKWDIIPEVLQCLGAKIFYHKVAIRPGKPILFAQLTDHLYFFGLPGNPVSSIAGLQFFVLPLIRNFLKQTVNATTKAYLKNDIVKMDHLTYFFQGILDVDCSGRQVVFVIENQQSFKVGPGLQANCWVRVDHGCSGLDAGAMVEVYPYNNTLKEF